MSTSIPAFSTSVIADKMAKKNLPSPSFDVSVWVASQESLDAA
jgi:hypothetical protein